MNSYNPKEIEPKWQKKWEEEDFNKAEDLTDKEKAYFLIEFPYPSGAGLHVGHVRSYVALDIMARKARMEGKNVLYPIGWDAFGLPTENYAIKNKIHPIIATEKNINTFRGQLKSLGLSFDWSREVNTTDPKYYKWTQWIFLKLWERGLAYKQKTTINWCPSCRIGLANEEVIDSKCERCGTLTEKKEKEQWMLKITEYADRLLKDLDTVDYSERIKTQQVNWIGKSEGAEINFNIADSNLSIRVFTTRPDTIFGATFMVISPEHPVIENLAGKIENFDEVSDYIFKAKNKSDMDRTQLNKDKSGVELKEVLAINPANKEEIPVFVADYVLMSYGTGAIMSVPAHDERDYEFAKKYNLPIKPVVLPVVDSFDLDELKISQDKYKKDGKDPFLEMQFDEIKNRQAYIGEGINWNSYSEKISLDGLETKKAKEKIIKWLEDNKKGEKSIKYKLRDWVFSRQHYWGEPIPMINCPKCGFVPVPESELPVTLPEVEHYEPRDDGESPLKTIDSFVNVKCPKCGGEAERETDTMPNWAGSSWYFLRYIDPHNDLALVDKEKAKYFMPIDLYNGGMEHTTLHLLYSRFWNKF
ncbi:MAG: leucine--tRNA ligase, partial [Candidatus Liptonbacteria bacterium CG11_big_fil_rev_8_21_14_0_20_35_14]